MIKYLRIILATFALALALVASAATPAQTTPVRWRTSVRMTSDNEGVVTFKALIAQGWHLYGLELPQGGPRPTRIDLSASTGLEYTSPVAPSRAPLSAEDPMFGLTLSWWDSNVSFSAPFRLTGDATPMVKASITFMACDGTTCMPPRTETISAPVVTSSR